MLTKLFFRTSVILCSLLVLSGCSRRIIDFTVISSKNVPITEKGTEFKKATTRVKGVDSKTSILFFQGMPDMKEAIDDAIEKYPGAVALTDGVIYSKSWSCFLFGKNKFEVEGTPLYPESGTGGTYSGPNTTNAPQPTLIPQATVASQPVVSSQSSSPGVNVMRVTHTVEDSETLTSIASAYKVSILDIMKWNELSSNTVRKGMKLIVYIKE